LTELKTRPALSQTCTNSIKSYIDKALIKLLGYRLLGLQELQISNKKTTVIQVGHAINQMYLLIVTKQ